MFSVGCRRASILVNLTQALLFSRHSRPQNRTFFEEKSLVENKALLGAYVGQNLAPTLPEPRLCYRNLKSDLIFFIKDNRQQLLDEHPNITEVVFTGFDIMTEPDQAHFESIPWCFEIINHPDFLITPTFSRQPKPDTEDSLTAETLKRKDAISACLTVYKRPPQGATWIDEVRSLMTLGTGMNGGPFMLHGGIVATLMDDVVGTLMTVNQDKALMPLSSSTVTAYMNVQYLRPIATPQTVLVVAKSREVKGRKFYVDSEIRDDEGTILAKAESLWVRFKERL